MSFASSHHVKHKGSPSSIVPVISRTGSPKSGSEVNKVRGGFNYRLEDNKMVEYRDVLETMLPREQWKNTNGKFLSRQERVPTTMMESVPGADRGPRAGSPRGVVDATGSQRRSRSPNFNPVATAPGT